jgi:hypothetical protein
MSVCVYFVLLLSGVSCGLATGWSPSSVSYRLYIGLRNWKNCQGPKGRGAVERKMILLHRFWRICKSKFFRGIVVSPILNSELRGWRNTLRMAPTLWPVWHAWSYQEIMLRLCSSAGHWGEQTSSPRQGGSPRGGNYDIMNELFKQLYLHNRCYENVKS